MSPKRTAIATAIATTLVLAWNAPAAAQATRNASICSACWTWNGLPLSSTLSVELMRFIPSFAAHSPVALDADPHQIRSRSPGDWG